MSDVKPVIGRHGRGLTSLDRQLGRGAAPGTPPHRRRRVGAIGLAAFGVVMLLVAFGIVANLVIYKDTAKADAASLADQLAQKMALADQGPVCTAPPPSAPTRPGEPRMLLTATSIGLNAPVLDGATDHILDLGVGHVPSSRWPDQPGNDVLAAHNATFFVRLPDLKPGDTITLTAPCRKWTYKVSKQQVVNNTTSVPASADSHLVLVTCWPITALFNTSDRYMLTADLVSADLNVKQASPPASAGKAPVWKATLPAGLAGTNLANDATGVATGRLTTAGTPSAAWESSPASLNAVGAAIKLFGGTIRMARDSHPSWWSTLAPGVPASALTPLFNGSSEITFRSPLNLTVNVTGDVLDRVDMTTTARVGSGTYRIDASATPNGDRLSIGVWKMTLIAGTAPSPAPPAPTAPKTTTAPKPHTHRTTAAPKTTVAPKTTAPQTTTPKTSAAPPPPEKSQAKPVSDPLPTYQRPTGQ
jgi:sortase A